MGRQLIHPGSRVSGFTLLEMIAVLAIMGILASLVVPSALRTTDFAVVRQETATLRALGERIRFYVDKKGDAPAAVNWHSELDDFADLSAEQILTNPRGVTRVYIREAGTPAPRVILLSLMKAVKGTGGADSLTLPPATSVTGTRFQTLWDTSETDLPSWDGWWGGSAAWSAGTLEHRRMRREYLVIERINLAGELASATRTVILNNSSPSAAASWVASPATLAQPLNAGQTFTLTLLKGSELRLYNNGTGTGSPSYAYRLSEAAPPTFEFDGTRWFSR